MNTIYLQIILYLRLHLPHCMEPASYCYLRGMLHKLLMIVMMSRPKRLECQPGIARNFRLTRQRDETNAFQSIIYFSLFFFFSITNSRPAHLPRCLPPVSPSTSITAGANTSKAFNIPIVVESALRGSVSHNRERKAVMASATLCFAAQSSRAHRGDALFDRRLIIAAIVST